MRKKLKKNNKKKNNLEILKKCKKSNMLEKSRKFPYLKFTKVELSIIIKLEKYSSSLSSKI